MESDGERSGSAPTGFGSSDAPILRGPAPGDPQVVEAILRALPDWFGIEEAILRYVEEARELTTWTAWDGRRALGFLGVRHHFPRSAEIHVMGVLPDQHGRHVGSRLLAAAERHLRGAGVRILQVKTLAPARGHEPYARTRAFYEARGFEPLEDFPTLWGKENPCRMYAKVLEGN